MDECEDREEGVPPSKSSLCGEQENQSKAQRNPPGPGPGPGPGSSCVSFKSDRSKNHPIFFKDHQPPAPEKIHQRPQSSGPGPGPGPGPASSCVSFKSDRSMRLPIHFKGEPGPSTEGFNMLAKTRQTWKLDGMNTAEYEIISRQYLPLYTNITVFIGTEAGLHSTPPPPKAAGKAEAKPAAAAPANVQEKGAAKPDGKVKEDTSEK